MTRETKIGLLVGLAFIILFGIILSEKGTGRNDQLITPPIAAYKSVVNLIPPTTPPAPQLSKGTKDQVVDRLTMSDPTVKLTDQAPMGIVNPAKPAAPRTVEPAPEPQHQEESLREAAPNLKKLLPPTPVRGVTRSPVPAANPPVTDVVAATPKPPVEETLTVVEETGTEQPLAETQVHTIKAGETLASVCRQYYPGHAYQMLQRVQELNKITKPTKLMVGQTIKIPPLDKALAAKSSKEAPAAQEKVYALASDLLVPVDGIPAGTLDETKSKTLVGTDKAAASEVEEKVTTAKKPSAKAKPTAKTYVVQDKDSLFKIARRVYGSEKAWTKIYEYNKKAIPNPRNLKSGLKLRLPPIPSAADELAAGPKVAD